MPCICRLSVAPVLSAGALALLLAAAPAALAKDASFKATLTADETAKTTYTSTVPNDCQTAPLTATQTLHVRAGKAAPFTAYQLDAGSHRGAVELGPSGMGYGQLHGLVGTIERQNEWGPNPCTGETTADPNDCGMQPLKNWSATVNPRLRRSGGRLHLTGLGIYFGSDFADPFRTCYSPQLPQPFIPDVAAITPRTLFSRSKKVIVLKVEGTKSWRYDDTLRQAVTVGTYTRTITLTLRRTR